ncbi:TSPAN7 [Mytilus coruscus]|uniref:Tetraspanin n=1 Tax=Mytilus coruscus TaxID=42192 RepID=A0A6J8A861_MYTCO|nr:TSPAN7 [Mytilus coruscus]
MPGKMGSAMATGPAVACMKTLLMVFNFLFWVTGIAILALGIWTKVDLYKYMELSSIYYKESPYILIGVGVAIVVVGSLGCCCTIKGNTILLYTYAAFLIVIFVVMLATGAAGFAYKGKLEKGFRDGLKNALKQYGNDTEISKGMDDLQQKVISCLSPGEQKYLKAWMISSKRGIEISKGMDDLQQKLKCCGSDDYTDWFTTTFAGGEKKVPTSCCKDGKSTCQHTNLPDLPPTNATLEIYTLGCYGTVLDFMQGNMGIIGGVALGISFLQLFGALFACCLAKNINKSKYEQVA